MSDRSRASAYEEIHVVRMGMSVADAGRLASLLPRCPRDVAQRVHDQIWLRSVFTEQRRRTRIAERDAFDARADKILALLDPPARTTPRERTTAALARHAERLPT